MLRILDINKPGKKFDTDHIVSAQPRLFHQEKGSTKLAPIWGATAFVDDATRWEKSTPNARYIRRLYT